jgi:hypothetical protein
MTEEPQSGITGPHKPNPCPMLSAGFHNWISQLRSGKENKTGKIEIRCSDLSRLRLQQPAVPVLEPEHGRGQWKRC